MSELFGGLTISPLSLFTLGFILALLLFWLDIFFILYHLIRFGIGTRPKQASLIFMIVSLFLFFCIIIAYITLALEVPPILKMIDINPN